MGGGGLGPLDSHESISIPSFQEKILQGIQSRNPRDEAVGGLKFMKIAGGFLINHQNPRQEWHTF